MHTALCLINDASIMIQMCHFFCGAKHDVQSNNGVSGLLLGPFWRDRRIVLEGHDGTSSRPTHDGVEHDEGTTPRTREENQDCTRKGMSNMVFLVPGFLRAASMFCSIACKQPHTPLHAAIEANW